MRRARVYLLWLGCIAIAGALAGCGGDGETGPTETASSRTVEGWALFESGDYEGAIEKFARAVELDDSYAEAYCGMGWSYAKLDSLSSALASFGRAIAEGGHGAVLTDSYAGSSPVYRDHDTRPAHFDSAAVYASNALSLERRYIFEHDETFDWHDLHLIMAQSYFALSDYNSANARVDSLSGNVQDPGSATFIEDLADEIERLETIYGG